MRKVYVDAQHGVGNRLRAIASAAAIARNLRRELVIVWQPDHHCGCLFQDLFDYDGPVLEESFLGRADGMACFNYMEAEAGSAKNAPIDDPGPRDLYFRSAYAANSPYTDWDQENRFIRRLRPTRRVLDMIASVPTPNDVGVHVRMVGGKGYEHLPYESVQNWTQKGHEEIDRWRKATHYDLFAKKLDALIAAGDLDRFFLAADNPETYEVFQERYGDRVSYLAREHFDRSAEQLVYALADVLLLSRTQLLLGSGWSSFTELAVRASPLRVQLLTCGVDF